MKSIRLIEQTKKVIAKNTLNGSADTDAAQHSAPPGTCMSIRSCM